MSPSRFAMSRAEMSDQDRPVMLAICGDSASGKTTLTRGLVEALGRDHLASMCSDDYHSYDRQERKSLPFTPLNPACNYIEIMEQHLQLVALGEPILKPVYDHRNGTLERPRLFTPGECVVVEGLFPLYTARMRSCFDLKVYLDPPEAIRRAWKVRRDTADRGYTEAQVLADLERREPESEAFIRPQRRWADIVVRFDHIESRHESPTSPLSATVLLRPTAPHPDLNRVLNDDTREAIHLRLRRDETGKPVDSLHVHAYASRQATRRVEEAIWEELGIGAELPDCLGVVEPGVRSEPLAVVQLLLLYHLLLERRPEQALLDAAR
jgi:phosphoribulokinase